MPHEDGKGKSTILTLEQNGFPGAFVYCLLFVSYAASDLFCAMGVFLSVKDKKIQFPVLYLSLKIWCWLLAEFCIWAITIIRVQQYLPLWLLNGFYFGNVSWLSLECSWESSSRRASKKLVSFQWQICREAIQKTRCLTFLQVDLWSFSFFLSHEINAALILRTFCFFSSFLQCYAIFLIRSFLF